MPYRRLGFADRLSIAVRDFPVPPATVGALIDPGDISLRLRDPAGVATTVDYNPGPIVRDSVGAFHYDMSGLTVLGDYAWYWKTTGTGQGADPKLRYFTLVGEFTPILLTFDEGKSQLNTTVPDADLEFYIDSATETVENWVGPVVPRVVTREAKVSWGSNRVKLLLPHRWIVADSITAATADGVAISVSGWTVGEGDGIVTLPLGSTAPYGIVMVTYAAGFDPIPTPLKESAGLVAQHSYATQRGGGGGGQIIGSASADLIEPSGSDFLLMLRAREKSGPYMMQGIA